MKNRYVKAVLSFVVITLITIGLYFFVGFYLVGCGMGGRYDFFCSIAPFLFVAIIPIGLGFWFVYISKIFGLIGTKKTILLLVPAIYLISNSFLFFSTGATTEKLVKELYQRSIGCTVIEGGEEIKYLCHVLHKLKGVYNGTVIIGEKNFCELIKSIPSNETHFYYDDPAFKGIGLGWDGYLTDGLKMRSSCYALYLYGSAEAAPFKRYIDYPNFSRADCQKITNQTVREYCYFEIKNCDFIESVIVKNDCEAEIRNRSLE
ncbi:MAG: hypothetical protein AAB537_01445 [Patescibacteria group bacterium]